MRKLTVSEFAESVGLNGNGTDYVGAGVMLRLLQNKGLAKEIKGGKRDHGRGRPKQLYEIADSVYDLLGGENVIEVKTPKLTVAEILANAQKPPAVVEVEEPVVEEVSEVEEQVPEQVVAESGNYHWDDDDE